MRTTFTLADDVAAEVEDLRRREGIGMSEAVNRLIRNGLVGTASRPVYVNPSVDLGLKELWTSPDVEAHQHEGERH